jgi:predicted nucleotidyltransferase
VSPETFTKDKIVYQIGVAPVRIDISTHIDGITFETAWRNRVPDSIYGVPVHFISLSDLITNKQSTGRGTDLEHVKDLEREVKKRG